MMSFAASTCSHIQSESHQLLLSVEARMLIVLRIPTLRYIVTIVHNLLQRESIRAHTLRNRGISTGQYVSHRPNHEAG